MKYNIKNGSGLICIIIILILALCFLRYYSLKKEKFEVNNTNNNEEEDTVLNNKLTKEFEKKWDFRHDCSGGAFKKKMVEYFKNVKKYRELEVLIRKQNDDMKITYDDYVKSMKLMEESNQNLDYCVGRAKTVEGVGVGSGTKAEGVYGDTYITNPRRSSTYMG
jgi:hypothetical protein